MSGLCIQPKGEEPKKREKKNHLGVTQGKGDTSCDLFHCVSVRHTDMGNIERNTAFKAGPFSKYFCFCSQLTFVHHFKEGFTPNKNK